MFTFKREIKIMRKSNTSIILYQNFPIYFDESLWLSKLFEKTNNIFEYPIFSNNWLSEKNIFCSYMFSAALSIILRFACILYRMKKFNLFGNVQCIIFLFSKRKWTRNISDVCICCLKFMHIKSNGKQLLNLRDKISLKFSKKSFSLYFVIKKNMLQISS